MSDTKKRKLDPAGSNKFKKGRDGKRNYYAKQGGNGREYAASERFMKSGDRGFLVTCNGRVRDCVRDSYRILNEYADELYGPLEPPQMVKEEPSKEREEVDDISIELQKEAEAAAKMNSNKAFRFQNVESGAMNCLFIRTTLEEPSEMAHKLMTDLSIKKKQKTRFILRMLPIEAVCRANLKDILSTVGMLSDRYFLKEPKSYAIIFHRRLNNDLSRDDVIKEVADLITAKNTSNKVNLKEPDLAVVIEVIKGLCCIGILPEYYQLRKYNLAEIAAEQPPSSPKPTQADPTNVTNEVSGGDGSQIPE